MNRPIGFLSRARLGVKRAILCAAIAGCAAEGPQMVPVGPVATAEPAPPKVEVAPPADPAPRVDGDVTESWLNGMQILVKRIPGAELAATQLYIRGGVRNYGAGDQGVEDLAMAVAGSGGTEAMPKDAFARRLAALGSSLGGDAGDDFSVLRAKGLRETWKDTFAMLADAFLHPALPASEVELQRERQLSSLRHEQESPDGRLGLLIHDTIWKGHPYERRAIGTIDTVKKLDRAALVAHLAKLRETSRLLLVVVGDLDAADVQAAAANALGALPRGSYTESAMPKLTLGPPRKFGIEKKLPTNYIASVFNAPGWNDPELPTAMVAISALRYREFEEVRTKRNLSYAPSARLSTELSIPYASLYVTAVDPETTMKVMVGEAKRLQTEPIPAKELDGFKSTFLTGFLMRSESTEGQAALLARFQLHGHDWRGARTLPEKVRAVKAEAIQAFARRYIANLQTGVVGSPAKLPDAVVGF